MRSMYVFARLGCFRRHGRHLVGERHALDVMHLRSVGAFAGMAGTL